MSSLDSRVLELTSAFKEVGRETRRIADLPMSMFRLLVFINDTVHCKIGEKRECICDLPSAPRCGATETQSVTTPQVSSRRSLLKTFKNEKQNESAKLAIDELGLTDDDLLDMIDLICPNPVSTDDLCLERKIGFERIFTRGTPEKSS